VSLGACRPHPYFKTPLGHEAYTEATAGNVLSAKAPDEKIPFISESDLPLYRKYRDAAFEVQVGLHELTGKIGRSHTMVHIGAVLTLYDTRSWLW
jgi:hypothetical protein